ncbi:C-type lectin domain family 4 member E-like [Alosa alosa]|uniref:C-type lectin domain family 4 member E-like n=1 Tax=Alosa alosa TaxID=278164 RepID=UPI0020153A2B|nr:C-type lectin domain family 4 member E-like [Alosa alosa]
MDHLAEDAYHSLQEERDCCPENWWKHSSSCYFISAVEKTWNESRQYCREKDGDLVIINSKEEQEFLNDNMKEGMKEIWIGLSDTDTEGVWRWVDGTPLTGSCRMWRMGEPNDSDGNEDCAVFCRITPSSPQHSSIIHGHPATLQVWNDVPCFRPMPFISSHAVTPAPGSPSATPPHATPAPDSPSATPPHVTPAPDSPSATPPHATPAPDSPTATPLGHAPSCHSST